MIDLYTTDQVRAMDERSIARGRTPDDRPGSSLALMERAAGHLARAVTDVGGRAYGLRVGVLAGKGNNGGDGVAAARRLLRAGADPRVCLVAGSGDLSPDGEVQLRRYRQAGGRLEESVDSALAGADVAVDCLLGTGARGEPRSPYREAAEALNAGPAPVVACDLPSGVDADRGAVPGVAVRADVTVTLGAHKRGLWLWPARGCCGTLVLGDLGIVGPGDEPSARVLDLGDAADTLPTPAPDAHKRSRGVVVAFAGSAGMSGAAVLVARGAMAAGAGLVTVATAASERGLVASAVPEALTVGVAEEDPDAAFEQIAAQVESADAFVMGPGLGLAEPTQALVRRLVADVDVPAVVDADALNTFRHDGDALAGHAAPLLVATPHEREFARLAGPSEDDLWADRATVAPERAKAWRTVVVAKGPGSLVTAPDGRVWVNATGGAALATGGTGDVLAGLLAGLVAQRPGADVVAAGVALHGRAGQLAALPRGLAVAGPPVTAPDPASRAARSVTALDVAAAVPDAWRALDGVRP